MVSMSMSAEAARRALEDAKGDDDFVRRYLDGDRAAFRHMQGLLQAAYPDDGAVEAGNATRDDAGLAGPEPARRAPALPTGDGGGSALSDWLLEAGDAGFAAPKSPAHYQLDYAPNVEIDPEFDRQARDWMYRAELPAGWAGEIARDYQRRAAKPPSADEVAQEREAVLGRLRRDWGDATDAKLAQVRGLIGGIGDDRLTETLDRSGLGNNDWLIRQLAILADRKAAKAGEEPHEGKLSESDSTATAKSPYRELAYPLGKDEEGKNKSNSVAQIADKSGTQLAESPTDDTTGRTTQKPFSYPDIPLGAGGGAGQSGTATKRPEVNDGAGRQRCIIDDTPCTFKIEDNAKADGSKPEYRVNIERDPNKPMISHEIHDAHEVDAYEKIVDEEAMRLGVDPDLVKAIMYIEATHGASYGHIAESLGLSNSILPMNIGIEPWKALGFKEADFKDPRMNIRAGVMLLKRIIERVQNPTVAKVATLWNNLRREAVNDFGARAAEVYRQKLWRKPPMRSIPADMP